MIAVDAPDVLREVEEAFARYEAALVANDLTTLDALFLDSPGTVRYGHAENLYGIEAVRAFRRGRSPVNLARTLERTVITTYGRDMAVASTLFRRETLPGRIGRQQQTWVRTDTGWRVAAAHISFVDDPEPASVACQGRGRA
jgi:hypothetical protein